MLPGQAAPQFTDSEREILERFGKAAVSPLGLFEYPTGREGLAALDYPGDFVHSLPDSVAHCYCGVGNPFAPMQPGSGWRVLDVGCGAGVDALAASSFVGGEGLVAGLEFSPEMLKRAAENLRVCDVRNIFLHQGGAESLPFPDAAFDMLISNGVYNLVLNKQRALDEAFRVLKHGGVFQVADQILCSDQAPACPLPVPGVPREATAWAR
ncbi:MAG: methyltransferase domain-containing protein [Desulfovibrio sp.]|jgi:SAM-dependent methyltransferase